ncbi:hypothetical protein GN956_G130 [Arapaima gigas]
MRVETAVFLLRTPTDMHQRAMTTYCTYISVVSLFGIIWVSDSEPLTVNGFVGQSVTLPCTYNAGSYGVLYICWGRGEIPSSGCNNQILATDGYKVTERKSDRYQLTGNLAKGDVSLTIVKADGRDAGIYGCRVEIPGLFNDQKDSVNLIIKTVSPSSPPAPVMTQTQATSILTQGHMDVNVTETINLISSKGNNLLDSPPLAVVAVAIAVPVAVAAVLLVFLLARKRCGKGERTSDVTEQAGNSIIYVNFSTDVGLDIRGAAVENVYEYDSSNQYEFCP